MGETKMWDVLVRYAALGVVRGLRGLSKHTKDIADPKKPDKFSTFKLGVSVLVAIGIGVATEFVLDYVGVPMGMENLTELIGMGVRLAVPWFGTGIIEDIVKK